MHLLAAHAPAVASIICSRPEPPGIQITESDAQSSDVTCLRLPGCEGADPGLGTSFWTADAVPATTRAVSRKGAGTGDM